MFLSGDQLDYLINLPLLTIIHSTSKEETSDPGMNSDKDKEVQQLIEHTIEAPNVKSLDQRQLSLLHQT